MPFRSVSIFIALLCCALLIASGGHASDAATLEKQLQQLMEISQQQQEQIKQMQQELNALKENQAEQESEQQVIKEEQATLKKEAQATEDTLEWVKRTKIHGDFRYRYEYIDKEGTTSRHRNRIRARLGATVTLSESLESGIMMASGDDESPISTNQTLGSAFSSKNFWIDLAYLDWHPTAYPGLNLTGGKMVNPLYTPGKSELLWDHDLRPEGFALHYNIDKEILSPFLTLGAFSIEERKSDSDALLYALQVGTGYALRENLTFTGGAGFFYLDNIQGYPAIIEDDFFGNTTQLSYMSDPLGTLVYAEEFTEVEIFAAIDFKMKDIPISLFGDYVHNLEADEDNEAWLVGFSLGKCKAPGSWEMRYNYRNVEADALLGVFTDSDFIDGGTDGKGHEIGLKYQVFRSTTFGATYFFNESDLKGPNKDFERMQLDAQGKF